MPIIVASRLSYADAFSAGVYAALLPRDNARAICYAALPARYHTLLLLAL